MNKIEITNVLLYLAADFDLAITEQRIAVWVDQFSHVSSEVAMAAARICLARKSFGFPRVYEFHEALNEVLAGMERDDWGDAWDAWVRIARKGRYQHEANFAEYERVCPRGARAMGTAAREYYDVEGQDGMNVFRAQFRQRFESVSSYERKKATLDPRLIEAIRDHAEKVGKVLPRQILKSIDG